MKRLIINADDFGMCEGVSLGIIKCHTDGVLTSTTLMTNMPFAPKAVEMARMYPKLGLGIHLVSTCGTPIIPGRKSFTDENGNFKKLKDYPNGTPAMDPDELYDEWKAQIELFIRLVGKKPTHIDSHHHSHLLPGNIEVAKRLAKEYDLPMRLEEDLGLDYEPAPLIRGFGSNINTEYFDKIITPDGVQELMCHPAFIDYHLYTNSSYCNERVYEMKFIRSQEFRNWLNDHNIELINYSEISKK